EGGRADNGRGGGADAENEYRDGERQHEDSDEKAAAAERRHQRGADGADQGERRRAGKKGQRHRGERQRRNTEKKAEQRGGDHQRQAGGEPVSERARQHDEFERQAGKEKEIEGAVLMVFMKQAVDAEKRGEKGADPQYRRANTGQEVEIGAEAEGHGGDHGEEEDEADKGAAATPEGETRGLPGNGGERTDHAPLPSVSVAVGGIGR